MSMQSGCWHNPPQNLALHTADLHLWRIALNVASATQLQLKSSLSPDECARAERLLDPNKALDFIVARGRLRQILGRYLNRQPTELSFIYGSNGKPGLEIDSAAGVSFNLAHSGGWALLAVARDTAVGVDLEQIDRQLDYRKIATQFFNPREIFLLNKAPAQRQRREFYRLWTSKEARLKRSGLGLAATSDAESACPAGQTKVFPIDKNYLGAVATRLEGYTLQRYQLFERKAPR
jgi:4'-phosphopantetheinyl transferase